MRRILEIIRKLHGEGLKSEKKTDGSQPGGHRPRGGDHGPPDPPREGEEAIRILKERGSIFQPRSDRYAPL